MKSCKEKGLIIFCILLFSFFMIGGKCYHFIKGAFCNTALTQCSNNLYSIVTKISRYNSIDCQSEIIIKEGFWLFSLPIDAKISAANFDRVWAFDSKKQEYTKINKNQKLVPGTGYWIDNRKEILIKINGKFINEIVLSLKEGWHLIGACSKIAQLSSEDGEIESVFGFTKTGYVYLRDHNCIIPGHAYWVYFKPFSKAGNITCR